MDSLLVDGEWCFDQDVLRTHVSNHFKAMYNADPTVNSGSILPGSQLGFGVDSVAALLKPITEIDVKCALDSIGPLKAPGPDGISAVFYQQHWDIVSFSLVRMVRQAFLTGIFPTGLNHSYISLIPKVSSPETVQQLRPIALSNVVYKLITKVIVQRLRPFLSDVISPFQSSFVPNRNPTEHTSGAGGGG